MVLDATVFLFLLLSLDAIVGHEKLHFEKYNLLLATMNGVFGGLDVCLAYHQLLHSSELWTMLVVLASLVIFVCCCCRCFDTLFLILCFINGFGACFHYIDVVHCS